jgi:phosphatidate phosphatase APP1
MKKFILSVLLVSFNSFAGIQIISDLDDTIKITHVAKPTAAAARGIFRKTVFTGVPEFLNEARAYSTKLHILTASPKLIKHSVLRTLNSNQIKHDSIVFKNYLKNEGKVAYKVRKIREIMDQSDDEFIFLGDDVDKDPEVFQEIQNLYPERVLATYVHAVRGRKIPAGHVVYYTSADLALREMLAGRMSIRAAANVLSSIGKEKSLHNVIPYFASCPRDGAVWDWQLDTPLNLAATELVSDLIKHCSTFRRK